MDWYGSDGIRKGLEGTIEQIRVAVVEKLVRSRTIAAQLTHFRGIWLGEYISSRPYCDWLGGVGVAPTSSPNLYW